jgi:ferredoxin
VRPKAIFLRDEFVPIRDGVHAVRNADAVAIELETNRLRAGELATGDYYCKLIGAPDEQRRRITQNTANSITIESEHPWDSPLRAGSEIEIAVRLQKPFVDTRYCTGCGICEHECPVSGLRAIRVTAENESRSAKHALVLDTRGRLQ